MAEQPHTHRTDEARAHDDHELIDRAERAPPQQGGPQGTPAAQVGARDEEKTATGGEAGTNVHKSDKLQPIIPTRADNEGANG